MITRPTLLLNEEVCRRNIKQMAAKAARNRILFRPHFKTHQSHEIGRWFREEGISAITVSSLSMAKYFADDGWNDILVAFPVNILEIGTINELAEKVSLSLLVESIDVVEFLDKNLRSSCAVYIKIDSGQKRTGIYYGNISAVSEILHAIEKSALLAFTGFLTHAGNSYSARSAEEVKKVSAESISGMTGLAEIFRARYPQLIVSVGDTPSCSIIGDFSMVDEIRPGNFVFYDFTQYVIGSCRQEDIAVAMACPVVAVHRDRNEIIVYGGAVHFSKDSIKIGDDTVYGPVVRNEDAGWGGIIEGTYLKKMSQEHGIIHTTDEMIDRYRPGDIIKIIPVHSCLTANLTKDYETLEGKRISHFQSM